MPTQLPPDLTKWPVVMLQIVRPPEAEELSGVDWDTLKRNHPDWIVKISQRCEGMRRGHALVLAA